MFRPADVPHFHPVDDGGAPAPPMAGVGLFLVILATIASPFCLPYFPLAFAAVPLGWLGLLLCAVSLLRGSTATRAVGSIGLFLGVVVAWFWWPLSIFPLYL